MKVAALDLGTNSFLCLVAEKTDLNGFKVLNDQSIITRLGQSVQKEGRLSKEALVRAAQAFSQFQETINEYDVSKVMAVTTSAARDAENFEELKALGANYGIPIKVISGEREAELSFQGAVEDDEFQDSLLLDIGGGSTEMAFFKNKQDEPKDFFLKSLPLGSVRLGEMFVEDWDDLTIEHLKKVKDQILKTLDLSWEERRPPLKNWIAVAGTPTTLKAIELGEFDVEKIEGSTLTLKKIKEINLNLISMSLKDRRKVKGLAAKRADVIPVGTTVLETLMEWSKVNSVRVSTKGLRFGLAQSLLAEGL